MLEIEAIMLEIEAIMRASDNNGAILLTSDE